MKKAYGVIIIVLTAVLSAATWVLIRKTSKIKKRQHKTDEDKIKHVETNEIPTGNTLITEEICTDALEDDTHISPVNTEKHENTYAEKKTIAMTKSQFINTAALIAAPVATLITALIAYFALKESMLQRENMYRPELYIGETKFMADISDMSKIKYYPIVKDSIIRDKQVSAPYLKINNIGMGTALHVNGYTTFKWEISSPILARLKMPQKKGRQSSENVYMRGNDSIVLRAGTENLRWTTDYIMPISQIGEGYMKDLLSPDFRTVINVSSWLMKNINSPVIYFTFPLELSYKDINDKWNSIKRDILIKCSKGMKSKDEFFITICSGQTLQEYYNEMKKMNSEEE